MTVYQIASLVALAVSFVAFAIAVTALGAAHRSGTAEASPSAVSPKPAVPVLHLVGDDPDPQYSRLDHLDGLPRGGSSLEQDER